MKTSHALRTSVSGKVLFVGIAGMCFALSAQAGDGQHRHQPDAGGRDFDDLNLASTAGARDAHARISVEIRRATGLRQQADITARTSISGRVLYIGLAGMCFVLRHRLEKAVRKVDNAHLARVAPKDVRTHLRRLKADTRSPGQWPSRAC